MTRTFIQTNEFSKNWDRLGFSDEDLCRLEYEIMTDTDASPVIKGTGGLRKKRFSLEGTGKSGGVRVCYVDFVAYETIYLITVYPKSEKDNLKDKEKKQIKAMIERIEANL